MIYCTWRVTPCWDHMVSWKYHFFLQNNQLWLTANQAFRQFLPRSLPHWLAQQKKFLFLMATACFVEKSGKIFDEFHFNLCQFTIKPQKIITILWIYSPIFWLCRSYTNLTGGQALASICVFVLLYTPNSELEQHNTWHTQTSIQRIGWVNTEVRGINVSLAHLWKWIHTRKSTVVNTRKGHLLHMEWMRC